MKTNRVVCKNYSSMVKPEESKPKRSNDIQRNQSENFKDLRPHMLNLSAQNVMNDKTKLKPRRCSHSNSLDKIKVPSEKVNTPSFVEYGDSSDRASYKVSPSLIDSVN